MPAGSFVAGDRRAKAGNEDRFAGPDDVFADRANRSRILSGPAVDITRPVSGGGYLLSFDRRCLLSPTSSATGEDAYPGEYRESGHHRSGSDPIRVPRRWCSRIFILPDRFHTSDRSLREGGQELKANLVRRCAACALTAMAGTTGVRSWLQAHHASWLTEQRLKRATVGIFVVATIAGTTRMSGSSTAPTPPHGGGQLAGQAPDH
jgi:hypothetical protein